MFYWNCVKPAFLCLRFRSGVQCLPPARLDHPVLHLAWSLTPRIPFSRTFPLPSRAPQSHSDCKPATLTLSCAPELPGSLVIISPFCCRLPQSRFQLPRVICFPGFFSSLFAPLVFPGCLLLFTIKCPFLLALESPSGSFCAHTPRCMTTGNISLRLGGPDWGQITSSS